MLMSLRSVIALAIILIISRNGEAKSLDTKYQVKFRRLPPREFSAALGSSITIECEAGASPPPTIHWLKNGKRIYLNEVDANNQLEDFDQSTVPVDDVNRIALSATRSRLYIDCADTGDEATYTCVAENAYSRISAHTKLNLIRPAVRLATTTEAPAMGGEENDLSPTGGELSPTLGGANSGEGGDGAPSGGASGQALLERQRQRRQQSGPGGNIDLALTAVPQCVANRLAAGSTPPAPVRIHMWTHNIVEIMKNNVVIYCRSNINRQSVLSKSQQQQQQELSPSMTQAQAAPKTSPTSATTTLTQTQFNGPAGGAATTVWTLPDDKLVSEELKDKYEVLETGDLLIKDLRWSDMGSYVCTVSDDRGSDSVSTFVYPASVKVSSKRSAATAATSWNLNIR